MAREESCDCVEYEKQLSECKDSKRKECEEKSKEQSAKIAALEKKIMTLTIVGAVAVTVIGKEMTDKIIDSFKNVQEVQQKITNPIGEIDTNDKNTDNSSSNGGDPFRGTN
jgi:hypothetical protein